MRKRLFLSGAAALAATSAIAFAASSSAIASTSSTAAGGFPKVPANQQVSITLGSYMTLFGAPGVNELNSLVNGFMASHPNIHVTIQAEANSAQIDGQIQQDEVSGQTPDVVQDTFNDLKFVTKSLGAVNLDQVVGKSNVAAAFGGPYKYSPAITKLAVIGGHVYGLPWTLSTPVLFYNADLFVKAGLNPNNPPTTWSQLQADALQIKQKTGADGLANGCVGAASSTSDWCLQAIIDSNGGSVMDPTQTKLTWTSKKTIGAIQEMQTLASAGVMPNLGQAQYVQAFAAGNLAMILNSSALTSTLVNAIGNRFSMYDTKLPSFGSTASVPTNSGSALFMLSKSKINREADWELMQYLISPASETTITENVGYPPLRPSIATQSQYLQTWANANHWLTPNLYQLEHIQPWLAYPGPNFAAVTTLLMNAVTAAVFQGQDVTQALTGAQSQASALLK